MTVVMWVVVIGMVIGLVVWLGPRPAQWRKEPETSEGDEGVEE